MGTTANLALPYPENTDHVANMAAAVQALANAIDTYHAGRVQWARKPADQIVTNTAVMQNDTALSFIAQANTNYHVDLDLYVTVSGSSSFSDLKLGWSLPAGASYSGFGGTPDVALASGSAVGSVDFSPVVGAIAGTKSVGLFSTGVTEIQTKAIIKVGATGGTVRLQWAQNTATTVNTTMQADSRLRAERIA